MLIAILGTTLSPYLYVWQASEEVEEEAEWEREKTKQLSSRDRSKLLQNVKMDVRVGMIASNVIFWCLVTAAAATLYTKGITTISSADQIATILQPLVGPVASVLFVLGIIGTGLLTIPVLAGSAAYAIAELKSWRCSLNDSYREATKFYAVIALFMGMGLAINLLDIPPIQMLIWSAILNAILAPPLLLGILWIANQDKIMKKHKTGKGMNVALIITLFVMSLSTIVWAYLTYWL
jgi:Mn2+/Fe2+ NRAMP family transporter